MSQKKNRFAWCFLLALLFVNNSVMSVERKKTIIVSIPPMQYLMQRIVGDEITVHSLISGNDNAELFEPGPKQLLSIKDASLYFPVGLPFEEKWLPVIQENNRGLVVADCCQDLMKDLIDEDLSDEELVDIDHDEGEHHHLSSTQKDPHLWTDPVLNREIVNRMKDYLLNIFPENKQQIIKNHKVLDDELDSIDREIKALIKNLDKRIFIVSHPAWSYFSDRYSLEQISIEQEGKEIGIRATIALAELAKKENIKKIFIQKQIKSKSSIAFAKEINAEVIEIDPLEYDHLKNLLMTAKLIFNSLDE